MSSASSAYAASSTTLNIVELIEKNPITKLSQTYNNFLLEKIQENFSTFEQQLFVSSFYCYLNYDKNTDFVVDLDDVWKWLGFAQKINVRTLLEKHFKFNVDYTVTIPEFKKLLRNGLPVASSMTPSFQRFTTIQETGPTPA